jgi:hypothetical protein
MTYNEANNTWTGYATDPDWGVYLSEPVTLTNVHKRKDCAGRHCVIHNPSPHHMREWRLVWRADHFPSHMERQCPHGIGHPDPDDVAFWTSQGEPVGIHSCDGCCGLAGVAAAQHVDGPSNGGDAVLSLV